MPSGSQLQATVSSVAVSATSVALFTAGPAWARYVFNDSTAVLYLKYGTGASTTSHTVQIPAGGFFEFPGGSVFYRGDVEGIWSSATGAARCTEVS